MYNLTVEFDNQFPTHAVWVTLDGNDLRITVSPRVEADVLAAALHPQVASAIADAVDRHGR
jgi:hypothetical protein